MFSAGVRGRVIEAAVLIWIAFEVAFAMEPQPENEGERPGRILIEAENADGMTHPFEIRRDGRASGGMKVGVAEGKGKLPETAGTATYRFKTEEPGRHVLWIRKWWEDGCGNSVRIGVDDFPPYMVGGDGTYNYWDWIKLPVTLELPAGDHRLTLYNNEDGAWVDQILLTSDPEYVPVGQESAAGSDPSRAEIYFSDDFMREEEQKGAWKVVSGTWETGSIRNPERSANAFQYISSGRKERLSTTGYSFWRDYSVEVSAMSAGRADMGISFLGSGASDCYLWRIPVAEGRTMRLVKIVGGEEETLFETAGRLIPGQWYRLQVTVCRGGIALAIDGCVVGRVSDFTYLRGGVGLFSKGIGETFFDDVLVRSVRLILDDFTDSMLSAWDITGNAFRTYGALDRAVMSAVMGNGFGADPSPPSGEVPVLAAVGKGKAITGSVYWDKYTFSFSVLPYLPSRWWALVGCGGDETVSFLFEGDEQGVTVSLEGSESPVHVPCKWRGIWHRIEIGSGDGIVTLNIDGTAVLEASRTVSDGLVGFHSETGGILFDNVAVRMKEAPSSGETVTHQFALEKTMRNWASRKYVWKDIDETGRSLWNRLDFPGNVRLTYSYGGELAGKETLRLGMSSKEGDKRAGCVLTVKRAGIVLETDTGGRSEAKLENARIDSVSVRRGGGSIIGAVNGRDLVKLASDLKEGADRLWIASSDSEVDVDKISLNAPDVIDYTMSMAPVDWRISNGEFHITNRWKCDPRWSWFSLMSPAEAIMWNKKTFRGDISLDMWASMKMELRRRPTYGDPGDLNLTFCADERGLGSGYSFIFGGYDNTATRLLREDVIVAETTEVLAPITRHGGVPMVGPTGLHRRWFHLAMKKRGNTIRCFLDEKMILEYDDPEPLNGGRIAVWTFDNGMMISRIRIAGEETGRSEDPLVPQVSDLADPGACRLSLSSDTHPVRSFDFEDGRGGWAARKKVDHFTFDWDEEAWDIKEDSSREVSAVVAEREGGGRCLEVSNISGGGTFAVDVPIIGVDLMKMPLMSFDYAIPADVFIDLFVKVGNRFYCVILTGNHDRIYGVIKAGSADIIADGKWHTAGVNLRDLLHSSIGPEDELVVEDAFFGNMDNRGYLVCGIGGNSAGSRYRLDNVVILGPGPASGEILWSCSSHKLHKTDLDRSPDTVPEGEAVASASAGFEDLAGGRWYLHILSADGNVALTRHIPIEVDTSPPAITGSVPWDGGPLKIELSDGSGTGVDPATIAVRYGDRMYSPDHPALSYDAARAVISLDPAAAGLVFEDGQDVVLSVTGLKDFLGNSIAGPVQCRWQIAFRSDFQPPSGVTVVPPWRRHVNDDFESGSGRWQSIAGKYAAVVERSSVNPARGKWCIRVETPRVGGSMACTATDKEFNAGEFPLLSFDYRMGKDVDVDIRCSVNGRQKYIKFSDQNSGVVHIGSVADVKKDGKWHRASIDLHDMLMRDDPHAHSYQVENIQFLDLGYLGNARGSAFFIDNFRVEPVCRGSEESLRWGWTASDASGLTRAFSRIDDGDWREIKGLSAELAGLSLADGIHTISVKAEDSAGNVSRVADGRVVVDNEPPGFGRISPGKGTRRAAATMKVIVRDKISGIDKKSIRFVLDGDELTISDPRLRYDPRKGVLAFTGWADGSDVVFSDGSEVRASVVLQDNAGNRSSTELAWTMDFSKDTSGPPAPYIAPVTPNVLFMADFEKGPIKNKDIRISGARSELRSMGAATGRRCLEVFNSYHKDFRVTLNVGKKRRLSDYPLLVFDYRVENGARFNVYLETAKDEKGRKNRKRYDIMFTLEDKVGGFVRLARVKPVDEGKWYRATLNLAKLVRGKKGDPNAYIQNLFIGNRTRNNPKKAQLYLDNISLAREEGKQKQVQLRWTELVDATGVVTYAFCVDGSPYTDPAEEEGKVTSHQISVAETGRQYFHVRGRDGAGNWGKTAHYKVR